MIKCHITLFLLILSSVSHAQLYHLSTHELTIYFPSDVYHLSKDNQDAITKTILDIGGTKIKEIYVEGHTDSFATVGYNDSLAANRATEVSNYLSSMGIPDRFIKVESFGEAMTISDRHEHNRRARIVFVYETSHKTSIFPPKVVYFKCIDKKTKIPVFSAVAFELPDKEVNFTTTNRKGISELFAVLNEEMYFQFSANSYLNENFVLPLADVEGPKDTLFYTIELTKVKVTGKFTFNAIYFFTDSDEFKPESEPDLLKLLALMKINKAAYIEIQGHMNYPINRPKNRIQSMYNMELSYKRAKAVYEYLIKGGVDPKRLTFKGMSNTRMKYPLPGNTREEDANKRVEVYLLEEV